MERMEDFFTARADGYDEHMLSEVIVARSTYDTDHILVKHEKLDAATRALENSR